MPVEDNGKFGLVVIKRNIEPAFGTWAFPGGYIGKRETAEYAALREFQEETGLLYPLASDEPAGYLDKALIEDRSLYMEPIRTAVSDSGCLIVFLRSQFWIDIERLNDFVPNDECSEIKAIWEPEDLGFSYHTRLAAWFFDAWDGIKHDYV